MPEALEQSVNEVVSASLRALCAAHGVSVDLHAGTALASLGVNSLQLIELIFELEVRFGVQVDEERLARLQTIADLQAMLAAARSERPEQESPA